MYTCLSGFIDSCESVEEAVWILSPVELRGSKHLPEIMINCFCSLFRETTGICNTSFPREVCRNSDRIPCHTSKPQVQITGFPAPRYRSQRFELNIRVCQLPNSRPATSSPKASNTKIQFATCQPAPPAARLSAVKLSRTANDSVIRNP